MTLSEIAGRFAGLQIDNKRVDTEEYCELVFYTKDTAEWDKAIAGFFGPAVKPLKARPSREDLRITEAYGGIQAGQVLFRKDVEGRSAIAMFWPWQDGTRTTLKIALLNNPR